MIFTEDDRKRIQERVLRIAAEDARVVGGAIVGSLAVSEGDRWSDLDLTFAVADDVSIADVLEDWTGTLTEEFDAIQLFDLPSGTSIYRVFLLPGCLQFDLSFTPASSFGATSPKFRLLFGSAVAKSQTTPPATRELFGYAVHHALRARICIERGRYWQAEYWLSAARDYGLSLACRNRGLVASHGRGFDDLPIDVRERFQCALPTSLRPEELLTVLSAAIDALLEESTELGEVATRIGPRLRSLPKPWKL